MYTQIVLLKPFPDSGLIKSSNQLEIIIEHRTQSSGPIVTMETQSVLATLAVPVCLYGQLCTFIPFPAPQQSLYSIHTAFVV